MADLKSAAWTVVSPFNYFCRQTSTSDVTAKYIFQLRELISDGATNAPRKSFAVPTHPCGCDEFTLWPSGSHTTAMGEYRIVASVLL